MGRDHIPSRAADTQVNSDIPEIGAVIKLNMSIYGRVGVVLSYNESEITYYDTNGSWNGRAVIRTIKINDSRILGYRLIR